MNSPSCYIFRSNILTASMNPSYNIDVIDSSKCSARMMPFVTRGIVATDAGKDNSITSQSLGIIYVPDRGRQYLCVIY